MISEGFPFRLDPGPCPIDDAAHTTCCSPDYTGRTDRVVVVEPIVPATTVVVRADEPPAAPPLEPKPTTFTTTSYRRDLHGRAARHGGRR